MPAINKYELALDDIMIKFDEYNFIPLTTLPDDKTHFHEWFKDEVDILKELIEKENAKTPVLVQNQFQGDYSLSCPECKKSLIIRFYGSDSYVNYCPYCGQKLDLSSLMRY